MNAIFCMFTHFTYEHMILYMNYTSIVTKGQKRVKKGPKRGKKRYKLKKPIGISFIQNFLYNTKKPYRIHYVNHIYVIRGHWHSKKEQKIF